MRRRWPVVASRSRCSSKNALRLLKDLVPFPCLFAFRSRAPSRLYPVPAVTGNQPRSQFAPGPPSSLNHVSPAKMKVLKPRPPLYPAPERPLSAPHSPPASGAQADGAEAASVAPFSDPPGGTKVPSVHTQMRMHMRLNAGEAMGGGVHERFNSQPPPKVLFMLLVFCWCTCLMHTGSGATQRDCGVEWATTARTSRGAGSICHVSARFLVSLLSTRVLQSLTPIAGMMTACLRMCGGCRLRMGHRLHARERPSCDSSSFCSCSGSFEAVAAAEALRWHLHC